ncbi:MAG: Holliday junction branch migration protein RuvA [Dehalococcoidia bacterium]
MITHLRGRLTRMDLAGPIVEIDVHGVGYEVMVPLFLWPELQGLAGECELAIESGPEVLFHVHYSATTNQPVPVLVGFLRRGEREFFRKFISVEGIGPAKAAKALNLPVSVIASAIEREDRPTLTRLPGIGARGADKIIATLRGKLAAEAAIQDGGDVRPVDAKVVAAGRVSADSVEAIAALGFPRGDAKLWVEQALADDPSLQTLESLTLAVLRARGAN